MISILLKETHNDLIMINERSIHFMHIEYMGNGSYAIFNTVKNHNEIHKTISEFLISNDKVIQFSAFKREPRKAIFGNSLDLLDSFEIIKNLNPIKIEVSENRSLVVSGNPELLQPFLDSFFFEEDEEGGHHHPEMCLFPSEFSDDEVFTQGCTDFYIESDDNLFDYI